MIAWSEYNNLAKVKRQAWDPTEVPLAASRSRESITGLELHHTGGAGPRSLSWDHKREWLLSIERYHEQGKGWRDIFYNVFVFADGQIVEGRNVLVPSQSNLGAWVTVHVPGNNPVLTQRQKQAIANLAKTVGGTRKVRGHSERSSTACPGGNVMKLVNEMRAGAWEVSELEGIAKFIQAVKDSGASGFPGSDGKLYVWDPAQGKIVPKLTGLAGAAAFIEALKSSGAEGYKAVNGVYYVWDAVNSEAVTKYVMVDGKPTRRVLAAPPVKEQVPVDKGVKDAEQDEKLDRLHADLAAIESKVVSNQRRVAANESAWAKFKSFFSKG